MSRNEIKSSFVDHAHPVFDFMPRDENILVFSCHSLEQVAILPQDYFVKLAESADSIRGVHIEPFGFQAVAPDDRTEVQIKHQDFAVTHQYNTNLMDCIRYAVEQKAIRIEHMEIDFSNFQPGNPSSWISWTKYR